jgi:tol-pal system protein YbgF
MKRTTLAMGAAALCLTGLLCACGPGNTLAVGKGSDDFRLKAVEANLQKAQEELTALSGRQQQNDARLAEINKQVGEIRTVLEGQGLKLSAAGSRGSALGVGFAHPGAAAAPEPAARDTSPAAAVAAVEATQPPAGQGFPGPANGHVPASPTGPPAGVPPAATAAAARGVPPPAAPAAAESRARRPLGRVGPPETSPPATPEAAIAADRGEAGPGAQPSAAAAAVAAAVAPPAAPAPSPEPVAPPTPAKAEDAPAPKGTSPAPGYAETATPAQKAEYNKALQLAINGRTAEAKAAFDQFLTAHPASPLAPNALYWVGEGAFATGDYQTAIADFDKVAKGWPGHHKAADSLYKMAMAQEKAGDVPAARASLERYLKDYPNAELAGVARQKLQALPK